MVAVILILINAAYPPPPPLLQAADGTDVHLVHPSMPPHLPATAVISLVVPVLMLWPAAWQAVIASRLRTCDPYAIAQVTPMTVRMAKDISRAVTRGELAAAGVLASDGVLHQVLAAVPKQRGQDVRTLIPLCTVLPSPLSPV